MLTQLLESIGFIIVTTPFLAGIGYISTYAVAKFRPNFWKLNLAVFLPSLLLVPIELVNPNLANLNGNVQLSDFSSLTWVFIAASIIWAWHLVSKVLVHPERGKLRIIEKLKISTLGFLIILIILIIFSSFYADKLVQNNM